MHYYDMMSFLLTKPKEKNQKPLQRSILWESRLLIEPNQNLYFYYIFRSLGGITLYSNYPPLSYQNWINVQKTNYKLPTFIPTSNKRNFALKKSRLTSCLTKVDIRNSPGIDATNSNNFLTLEWSIWHWRWSWTERAWIVVLAWPFSKYNRSTFSCAFRMISV